MELITTTIKRKGKRSVRRHLFITSIRTTPEALLRLIRQRWSIENEWHWVRDTQLGEDAHRYANRIGFLRQHCPVRDQRHLVLLAWMVAGLLLSETICFDRWKTRLPLAHCLASSWQRRCQRWLSNRRIDVEVLYAH